MQDIDAVVTRGARNPAHPAWSSPIARDAPRIEAICRRFCAMGDLAADEPIVSIEGRGGHREPRWRNYRLAAAQWLAAADAVDPRQQRRATVHAFTTLPGHDPSKVRQPHEGGMTNG